MIKSQIWDTLDDEKFRNITLLYFNKAQGANLPYNLTDLESMEKLNYLKKEFCQKIMI